MYADIVESACKLLSNHGVDVFIDGEEPSVLVESELYDLMRTYVGVEEAQETQRQLVIASLEDVIPTQPEPSYNERVAA